MKIKIATFKREDDGDYLYLYPNEDINEYCEDAQCMELIADDIIGYIPGKQVNSFVHNLVRKMRIGSTLVITGVDIGEVVRNIQNRSINLTEANILLYGNQENDWEFRQSCLTGVELAKILQSLGFKVVKNSIKDFKYVVKAERV